MRVVSIVLAGTLASCALSACAPWQPPAIILAAEAASVVVFGRGVIDLGVSAISGRDCSIVRLDRGKTYCAPIERVRDDAFCTRSLGVVDCWASPALLPAARIGVADTPEATPAQERYRIARWPKSLTAD